MDVRSDKANVAGIVLLRNDSELPMETLQEHLWAVPGQTQPSWGSGPLEPTAFPRAGAVHLAVEEPHGVHVLGSKKHL